MSEYEHDKGWFKPFGFWNKVRTKALILGKGSSKDGEQSTQNEDPDAPHNVATSLVYENYETKYHIPVLDIDMHCAVFPSSTEGKFHLYIDCPMTWEEYQKLLNVMAEVGILEGGYAGASINKGYTAVRLPWIKKQDEVEEIPKSDLSATEVDELLTTLRDSFRVEEAEEVEGLV